MADGIFATNLANNYVNDYGGIEESLMASGDTGAGQAQPGSTPLSPGVQREFDSMKSSLPNVSMPDSSTAKRIEDSRNEVAAAMQAETNARVAALEKKPGFVQALTDEAAGPVIGAIMGSRLRLGGMAAGAALGIVSSATYKAANKAGLFDRPKTDPQKEKQATP